MRGEVRQRLFPASHPPAFATFSMQTAHTVSSGQLRALTMVEILATSCTPTRMHLHLLLQGAVQFCQICSTTPSETTIYEYDSSTAVVINRDHHACEHLGPAAGCNVVGPPIDHHPN